MYRTPLRPTGSPEPNSRRRSPSRRHRSPRPRSKSGSSERPRRSRSHSPGRPRRSRSRSPSRPRRSKSRSPSRPRRSKSRSPSRPRRSKSRSPVRSRRSRSRSPGRKRRSRSRSPGRKRRSRSRSSGRKRRSRSRSSGRKRCSRSRSSGRPRRSRSSSPGRPRRSRSSSPGRPRRSRSSSPGRPRRSRSRLPRSRPRRSPPTSVRRRSSSSSPEDVNSRSQDDKDSSRYSPSFPTVSASESSRASKSSWGDPDRSAAARRSEDIPGKFQSDSDRAHKTVPSSREGVKELKQPPEELKPKSILKKRPEPDPSITPTQIDSYLSSIPRYTTALPTSSQFPTLGMPSVLESSKSPVRSGNLISVTTGDGTSNLTQVTRPQAATPGNYNTITSVVLSDNIGNKQSPAMPVSNKTTGTTAENRSNLLTVQVSGNTTTSTKLGECVPNSNVTPVNNVTPLPQDSLGNKDFTLYSQNEALKDEITRGGQYSQMGNFLNLFNKAACESQGIPYYSPRRFGQKIGASQENSDPIFPIQCEQVEDVKSKQPPEPVKPKDSSREEVEKQRKVSEIEDEERFLYGDDDVKPTSETLSDNRNQKPSQPDPVNTADKQEFDKIHDLLKTIGLDIGVAEIGKLAIRTQERLHGKKVTHQAKPSVTGLQCSVTSVVDSKPKPSASPSSAEEKKKVLSSATVKPDQSFKPIPVHNPEPTPTGPPPKVEIPKIPSAAPTKPLLPPVDLLQIPTYPPYSTTQMESGYNMPSHSYDPYSPYVAYPASSWQMYNQANQPPPSRMSVAPPSHMSMAPPSHMSMAPPSHMSMAPPSHMSMAPPSHMSGAPPSHMSGAPPSHMSGAPPSHMSGAPPSHMAGAPPSHMAGAPPSHMAGAPPSHMAGAPPSHMAGAPPSHMAGAPPSHMAGAPPSHMAGAPPSHMAGAPPSHMAGAPPSHMAGARPSHMSGDRPSHMSGDRPSHMSGDRPSHMSGDRPSHMSGARPSHMSGAPPSHMSGAPPSHMSGAPPSHMSGAPPSHMSGAPPSHMSGAPPSHMSGAPPSHMSGAPPSHMSVASTSAPGSTITHSNLCVIQTTDDDYKRKVPVPSKVPSPSSAPAESPQVGDSNAGQKNKKTEKIKVLEELESLRKQQNVRKQIVYRLNTNVEQLRVQQGILLRRKHREKDGHKNPLLEELNKTLKSAEKQMSNMRREIAAASKKEQQLTVVAQILGLNPTSMDESSAAADPPKIQETSVSSCAVASKGSDKELRIPSDAKPNADSKHSSGSHGKDSQHPSNKSTLSLEPKPKEALQKNSETRSSSSSSSFSSNGKSVGDSNSDSIASKSSSVSKPVPESKKSQPSDSPCEKPKSKSPRPSKPLDKPSEKSQTVDVSQLFHYFDSGDHWCEDCNSVCGKLQDFLCHMHAKKHNQTVNVSKRPWAKKTESETRPGTGLKGKVSVPLRGPEFLIPVNGFYCLLCEELFGDHIVVEEHLKAFAHNDKYKKYVEVNNTYEQKRLANRVAGLAAIQETERRLKMEQKRKLDKKNSEDMEDLKNKKVKKADEERQKPKTHNEVQPDKANTPDKPEKSQNPKKEKEEPVKIPTFGKFTWKIPESKAQVAAADSVSNDTAASPEKNKEESIKGGKQKGIDIKLLGKPPSSPGSTWTPFTSSSAITTPTTSPTSNATSQTKVKPNLPIPVLRKSSTAPISKPAPLNTFLSIKSPNTTPKPLPVVKSKPDSTLICDVITKPFGAEPPANTLKENAETSQQQLPDSPRVETVNTASAHQTDKKSNPAECSVTKPVNKRSTQQNKPPNQSPLGRNNSKGQNPNDTPVKKIENVKETKLGPSTLTENSYKKSSTKCEPQNSKTAGPTQVKGSAPAPKTAPVSSTQRPLLSSSSSPRLQSNPNVKDSQGASDGKLQQKPNTKTFAGAADTTSNSSKVIPKGIVVPNSIKTNKPERTQPAVPKAVNKAAQKLPENKPTASPVPGAAPTPKQTPTVKHKPAYSNTVKLNRKFKSEPLTLPSSLFGQMPDMSCKDIKITPSVAQNSNVNTEEGIKKPTGTCQKPLSVTSDTKIDRAHLEEELDSYYKLLAAEEDIEDVTTSEDQDVAMEIPSGRSQDIAMEIPPAPLKAVISPKATLPDLSTSELYDVDMACEEAPEAPGGPECAATSFSGLLASRTGAFAHRTQKTPIAATKTFVVAGAEDNVALKNDQGQQVYSPTEYSMEDLSVLTTCDSD